MIILGIFLFVVATDGAGAQSTSVQCLIDIGNLFNRRKEVALTTFQIIQRIAAKEPCKRILIPNDPLLEQIRSYCRQTTANNNIFGLPVTHFRRTRTACVSMFWPPERDSHASPRCSNTATAYLESAGDALDKREASRDKVKQYMHVFPDNVRNCINQQCEALRPTNLERLALPGKHHACRAILSDEQADHNTDHNAGSSSSNMRREDGKWYDVQ